MDTSQRKLFARLKRLAKLSKSAADEQEVLEAGQRNFLVSAVSDIKRNWVDIKQFTKSFTKKHILKGKYNVGKFTSAV